MRNRGYTLVEVLLVLALVGIVTSLTAPPLMAWLARVRVQAALNRLTVDIQHARMLGVRSGHGAVVRLIPSSDCPGGGHAYVVATRGPSGKVVRRASVPVDGPRVCIVSNNSDSIAFNSRGLLIPFSNRTIRGVRGDVEESLTISVLGRIYRRF